MKNPDPATTKLSFLPRESRWRLGRAKVAEARRSLIAAAAHLDSDETSREHALILTAVAATDDAIDAAR